MFDLDSLAEFEMGLSQCETVAGEPKLRSSRSAPIAVPSQEDLRAQCLAARRAAGLLEAGAE